jgi:negative regulator of sigma E activity
MHKTDNVSGIFLTQEEVYFQETVNLRTLAGKQEQQLRAYYDLITVQRERIANLQGVLKPFLNKE